MGSTVRVSAGLSLRSDPLLTIIEIHSQCPARFMCPRGLMASEA